MLESHKNPSHAERADSSPVLQLERRVRGIPCRAAQHSDARAGKGAHPEHLPLAVLEAHAPKRGPDVIWAHDHGGRTSSRCDILQWPGVTLQSMLCPQQSAGWHLGQLLRSSDQTAATHAMACDQCATFTLPRLLLAFRLQAGAAGVVREAHLH